jgi:hypothetical protein
MHFVQAFKLSVINANIYAALVAQYWQSSHASESAAAMKALAILGALFICTLVRQVAGALEDSKCVANTLDKAKIAYGVVASADKFVKRGHILRSWWTQDTWGAGTCTAPRPVALQATN